MKRSMLGFFLMIAVLAEAQYSVRLVVTDVATRKQDDMYVMGNFNNWNPKDENYKLKPFVGGRKAVVLKDIAAGTYAFRFTRGSADKIESTADGRDIAERVLEVSGDDAKEFVIAGWKDDYPDKPKPFTASPQVRVLDTAFAMPQLNRKRRVWIYLPKGYATSSKTYPVLYMQDGQNLFNEQTADNGEWRVDETLDSLQVATGRECIVVGIDHGGNSRNAEYNPYDVAPGQKGEGDAYVSFIVNTLKPFIDSKYRTKKGRETTFIAGSEKGGLISLYAIMKHPNVFGGAGVLSPEIAAASGIFTEVEKLSLPTNSMTKWYLYAGKQEVPGVEAQVTKLENSLKGKPGTQLRTSTYPLGKANAAYWGQEFVALYLWLMN